MASKKKRFIKGHRKINKYAEYSKVDKQEHKLKSPEVDEKQRKDAERSYRSAMRDYFNLRK